MEAEIVNSLSSLEQGLVRIDIESCRTAQTDGGPGSEDLWSDARDEQITGAGGLGKWGVGWLWLPRY
jgi:hypothetical protein